MDDKVVSNPYVKYQDITDMKYRVFPDDFTVQSGIMGYGIDIEFIKLTPSGMLTVRRNYLSDGPSGPTRDTPGVMRGAFAHDAGYELIRRGLLPMSCRDALDKMLERLITEDMEKGVDEHGLIGKLHKALVDFRAKYWHEGVEHFAEGAAEPSK